MDDTLEKIEADFMPMNIIDISGKELNGDVLFNNNDSGKIIKVIDNTGFSRFFGNDSDINGYIYDYRNYEVEYLMDMKFIAFTRNNKRYIRNVYHGFPFRNISTEEYQFDNQDLSLYGPFTKYANDFMKAKTDSCSSHVLSCCKEITYDNRGVAINEKGYFDYDNHKLGYYNSKTVPDVLVISSARAIKKVIMLSDIYYIDCVHSNISTTSDPSYEFFIVCKKDLNDNRTCFRFLLSASNFRLKDNPLYG